jgi:hypothetical protein
MSKKKMHYIDKMNVGTEAVAGNWQNKDLTPYSEAELATS